MNEDRTLTSAQVLLKAENTQPEAVREIFTGSGFSLGPLVGNSFSITAPAKQFETFFNLGIESPPGGGLEFVPAGEQPRTDLQAELLPANLRDQVEMIVFSKPPDFGPFNP